MTFAKKDQRQVFMPKSQTAYVNRAYYILIILRAYLECPARRLFFIKLCSPTVDIPSRVYLIKTCDTISVEVVDQGLRVSPERGV